MKRIALWGLGRTYNLLRNTIRYFELTKQIVISAIIASDAYMDELDGYPVIKPDKITYINYDYIFIMTDVNFYGVIDIAVNQCGIPRKKLISYKVLQIPELDIKKYFALYESGLTIVSNNCWGGIAYNTLCMECQSPFKNLFLTDADYLKLVKEFPKYINISPTLVRYEVEIHSHITYPVLSLGDIEIHCNHTTEVEKAIYDWKRRREKINFSNLFFEMYTEDESVACEFENIIKSFNGICFVPYKVKGEKMMQIPIAPGQNEFYEAVNVNASLNTYGLKYNLVELLNGEIQMRY